MAYGQDLMFVVSDDVVRRLNKAWEKSPAGQEAWEKASAEDREYYWGPRPAVEHDGVVVDWDYERLSSAASMISDDLQQVHRELVLSRFDEVAQPQKSLAGRDYVTAHTPVGFRTFAPFSLGMAGDEDGPQTTGISTWSRYFPVWSDWRFEFGGSSEPIVFDDELLEMQSLAKAAIAKVLPEILDAPTAAVFCHY